MRFKAFFASHHLLAQILLPSVACVLPVRPSMSAEWRELIANDAPAHAEFVRELRYGAGASQRIALTQVAPATAPVVSPSTVDTRASDGFDQANASVSTRSLRDWPCGEFAKRTVAFGTAATRIASQRRDSQFLLLAMLRRFDHERLVTSLAPQSDRRHIGVLPRDLSMADQRALMTPSLLGKRHWASW